MSGLHDTTSVMYTEEYQVEYYEMNNKVFDEFDFVVGEQAWNFADFATSQSLLRVQGNKKGLFTRDRKPKMVAHYFRNRWSFYVLLVRHVANVDIYENFVNR